MKKLTAILFLSALFSIPAFGQEISEHALGLRLGDSDGFGAEISYQRKIKQFNRLEIDLGWRDSREFDAFKLTGVYQWVDVIDGGFNWYYGFGGGLGNVDFEPITTPSGPFTPDGGLFVFAAGNVGVEYNFDIPLLISLDIRPELGLVGYGDFDDSFDFDIALGLRYQF